MDPAEINCTFVSFYKSLYQTEFPISAFTQNKCLDGLDIPSIFKATKLELDGELELEEAFPMPKRHSTDLNGHIC